MSNPYAPTESLANVRRSPSLRSIRTYLEAAWIGGSMSLLAPLCNTIYCSLVLGMPPLDTFRSIVASMVPLSLYCVAAAMVVSAIVPQRVCCWLSGHQVLIPFTINSILFAAYFSLLGLGYVRGSVTFFGFSFSYYDLAPALISATGTMLHIIVRPNPATMVPANL